jgi:hypothetical protein
MNTEDFARQGEGAVHVRITHTLSPSNFPARMWRLEEGYNPGFRPSDRWVPIPESGWCG